MLHPDVPEALRGTYLGLATDPIIDHLLSLGVTAVELLPVHHFVTERRLAEMGLVNYWGYAHHRVLRARRPLRDRRRWASRSPSSSPW